MTIAELRRKRAALVANMTAITAKEADLGDESLPQADVDAFEALKTSISALDARIARLEDADAAAAASTASVDDDETEDKSARQFVAKSVYAQPKRHFERAKGMAFTRYVAGMLRAKQVGGDRAVKDIAEMTGDHEIATAVQKALATTGATTGQTLVPVAFSADWIELLRSRTVLRKINAMKVDLPNGNLSIPRLTGTATTNWGPAENTAITASDPSFDAVNLTSKKSTSFVQASNELISRSPIALEALLMNDMLESAARAQDLAFFAGSGTGGVPLGMFTLSTRPTIAPNTVDGLVATGATALDGAMAYLRKIVGTVEAGNSRMIAPFWTMNPANLHYLARLRDSAGGFPFALTLDSENPTLLGYPVFKSTQHATNIASIVVSGTAGSRQYFADAADIIVADEGIVAVDMSTEAGNAFAQNATVFRLVQFLDIGYRHPESVGVGASNGWTL